MILTIILSYHKLLSPVFSKLSNSSVINHMLLLFSAVVTTNMFPIRGSFVFVAEYDWQISEATGVASDYITDMITFLRSTFESFTNLPVCIFLITS